MQKAINKKQLSVIVPAYNEQDSIKELIERVASALRKFNYQFEIILVDDNSTDKTLTIARRYQKIHNVKVFLKKGKKGKAHSLYEGFFRAKFTKIAFIDADLQYAPEELPVMANKLLKADVIVANRRRYKDSLLRKVVSRTFRFGFGRLLFGLNHDIQSGLKVFSKEVLDAIIFSPAGAWSFDLEFLHSAQEAGFKIINHDITFQKRKKGNSKIGIVKASFEIGSRALNLKLTPGKPRPFSAQVRGSMRGAGLRYKKNKYVTHTTLPIHRSSLQTFTGTQKAVIMLTLTLIVAGLFFNLFWTLIIIVALLSLVYFIDTVFNLFLVLRSIRHDQEISVSQKKLSNLSDDDLPIYTILCPLYKESHIIPQFVENISKLSWPKNKLDVMLLLEEDDKESIEAAKRMELPSFVRVVVVPDSQPKTKPKACNYGLSFAKGEYLVIYDAEDMPDPYQLKKSYLAFQKVDPKVLCLQAKLNYYNPSQNLLTRFFTAEYSLWFDITLTGLQSINTSIPLGGTSNHFRTKDIMTLHGWDPFNVTEDADLGMRLFKEGYKTAIIDSVTLEEANSRVGNWIRQRSRWIKGYMQTYLVHTRKTLNVAIKNNKHYPVFHLVIGGKIAFIFINPFLWVATLSYFALNAYVGPTIERLYPPVIFYMAVASLVFGNFLFMYYYMIGVMKRKQYSLMKFTFLIPLYWLMISYAGFVALYQLFFKPFYWEKTIHGLHLKGAVAPKKKVIFPRVAPRPAFGFAYIRNATLTPIKIITSVPIVLRVLSRPLVLIGEIERRMIMGVIFGFKKLIVIPLRYAASMLT